LQPFIITIIRALHKKMSIPFFVILNAVMLPFYTSSAFTVQPHFISSSLRSSENHGKISAFAPKTAFLTPPAAVLIQCNAHSNFLEKETESDEPISFVEPDGSGFIDCFIDSSAVVNGVEYTIGTPCDYSVAIGYFDENDELIPIELDDEFMDEIFPVTESIIEEEFGEELTLLRTPQTLTLAGELEEEEDEAFEIQQSDIDDAEEQVEVILSFEYDDQEYHLLRLLDPVLLVGKADPEFDQRRIMLTPEESETVMPQLEKLFLQNFDEENDDSFH